MRSNISSRLCREDAESSATAIFFAQLLSWTTQPLLEAQIEGTPASSKPLLEDVLELRSQVYTPRFFDLKIEELEQLRLYERPNATTRNSNIFNGVPGQTQTQNDQSHDRPLLVLHPNGDWTILADVKFLPTPPVMSALEVLSNEIAEKWRRPNSLWNSFGPSAQRADDYRLSCARWTPLCVVTLTGQVIPGEQKFLKSGPKPAIEGGSNAVAAILTFTQPHLHRMARTLEPTWSTFISRRIERLYRNMCSEFQSVLQNPDLSHTQVSELSFGLYLMNKNRCAFEVVPELNRWINGMIPKIDNPLARLRTIMTLFKQVRSTLPLEKIADFQLLLDFDRFARNIWIEILPISIDRKKPWDQVTVGQVLTALNVLDLAEVSRVSRKRESSLSARGDSDVSTKRR